MPTKGIHFCAALKTIAGAENGEWDLQDEQGRPRSVAEVRGKGEEWWANLD